MCACMRARRRVHHLPLQQGAAAAPAARPGTCCVKAARLDCDASRHTMLVPPMHGPYSALEAACNVKPLDAMLAPHLQDLGRCRLRKNVKPAYGFDADGWQTFWQEDLFED